MKNDYTKLIGYVLFIATLIGWGITYGQQLGRAKRTDESITEIKTSIKEIEAWQLKDERLSGQIIEFMRTKND